MKKRVQKRKNVPKAKINLSSRIANILILISVFLLIILGSLSIIFNQEFYNTSKSVEGMNITEGFFLTYGIIWMILGFFVFTTNRSIILTKDKAMKWFLLVLGITAFITGSILGIPIIISSLIYLFQKK